MQTLKAYRNVDRYIASIEIYDDCIRYQRDPNDLEERWYIEELLQTLHAINPSIQYIDSVGVIPQTWINGYGGKRGKRPKILFQPVIRWEPDDSMLQRVMKWEPVESCAGRKVETHTNERQASEAEIVVA